MNTIFDPTSLESEIRQSHERSRQYGIDPNKIINPKHVRLSPKSLQDLLEENQDYFSIASGQMEELFCLFAGGGFAMAITDRSGYILKMVGDEQILDEMNRINCRPGFRWTERDVGTSAIALAHARMIPVQITGEQMYCRRGYGYTNSAAPIVDINGQLVGVIVITGKAEQVHPHTLGMMITAARSIENHLGLLGKSRELMIQNNYMNTIIDSIDSGVIALNRDGIINKINAHARTILKLREDSVGRPINYILRKNLDFDGMVDSGKQFFDRECFFRNSHGETVEAYSTLKPIFGPLGKVRGFILVFNEMNKIRRIVNEMAGSQARFTFEDIIGLSTAVQTAKRKALLSAQSKSTVLLSGETGTGKELFAQAIHNNSDRISRPFVVLNCGAIPRELLESELFGYSGGAFTGARTGGRPGKFELANGGTVLLDEIGDMPRDMQVKMLRVLQSGEVIRIGEHNPISVDIRIIAATHVDLYSEVRRGNFREDLFYRLNVFPITIPSLRERKEDILPLARHFLERCCQVFGKNNVKFSEKTISFLINYYWPGNVRELENIIERAVNLVEGDLIEPEHLGLANAGKVDVGSAMLSEAPLEEAEKIIISKIMQMTNYNISDASKRLGIARPTLYRKLKKYALQLTDGPIV